MKTQAFILLSIIVLPKTSLACQVILNGEDKTSDFFVIDSADDDAYVDCGDHSKCRGAVISDCPVIKCLGSESCTDAEISNFTDSVVCEGVHACHRTEMTAAASGATIHHEQTVTCIGSGACDVAHIVGNSVDRVSCNGSKACRKVRIEGPKLVKCQNGRDGALACDGFATLETKCVYCGAKGCSDHINTCRYKIIDDIESDSNTSYKKCVPEQVVGNCSDELKTELQLELTGKEEIDTDRVGGGSRKSRRLGASHGNRVY